MTGIEGLGRRVMAGQQGPDVPAEIARLDTFGLQVTPENVLGVREVILEEAQRVHDVLKRESRRCWVGLCGDDPVSKDAMEGFNEVTRDHLLPRAFAEVDKLFRLGDELAAAARAYGHTEHQIQTSFDRPSGGQR